MRAAASLLALGLALPPAACCSVTPAPADWMGLGFRTPAQCFRTFRTAFAAGQLDLEYRCISAHFKREHGMSQLGYREFRDELARRSPWMRCLARSRIVSEEELSSERHRIVAEVRVLFAHRRFAVELVREDFWEAWGGDELLSDDAARWEELVGADPDEPDAIRIAVPTYGEYALGEVSEIRVGREWKIDRFETIEDP